MRVLPESRGTVKGQGWTTVLLLIVLSAGGSGCRGPGGSEFSRSLLSKGIARALSERDELSFPVRIEQSPADVSAHVVHRRDGSGQLTVLDDNRPVYELKSRCDGARKLMLLTERNHVSGESIEYSVPLKDYYDPSYDPRMLGSIHVGSVHGCLVGSYWRSWLDPRDDFCAYLLEQVAKGRISVVSESGRNLVLVQTDAGPGAVHRFYFDPQEYLLRRWETVFPEDPTLNRDRTFVYHVNGAVSSRFTVPP